MQNTKQSEEVVFGMSVKADLILIPASNILIQATALLVVLEILQDYSNKCACH